MRDRRAHPVGHDQIGRAQLVQVVLAAYPARVVVGLAAPGEITHVVEHHTRAIDLDHLQALGDIIGPDAILTWGEQQPPDAREHQCHAVQHAWPAPGARTRHPDRPGDGKYRPQADQHIPHPARTRQLVGQQTGDPQRRQQHQQRQPPSSCLLHASIRRLSGALVSHNPCVRCMSSLFSFGPAFTPDPAPHGVACPPDRILGHQRLPGKRPSCRD